MTVTPAAYPNAADPASPLSIKPVGGRIGAQVDAITLSADLDDASVVAIRAALVRHKVLFFRGQHHLDNDSHEAFARRFGDPVGHPTVPSPEGTQLFELDSRYGGKAAAWHTDITFVPDYPFASILRAVTIPEAGGDTVWANTAAAYTDLPEALRALADTLWAVHSNAYDYAAARADLTDEQIARHRAVFASTVYETEHPVVRIHPESGERTLVLGQFVQRIVGVSTAESQRLIEMLQAHIVRLENSIRWRWQEGDVVIWDNRATQHYAVDDYGAQHRVVRRVTLSGDVPVSIDGRRSRAIKPAPLAIAAE